MSNTPNPITRKEAFYAAAIEGSDSPTPLTREEMFLAAIAASGGGVKPDTGVVTIAPGLLARNVGGVVTVDFAAPYVSVASDANAFKSLPDKIPEAFRPLEKVRCAVSINNEFASVVINPNGSMQQISSAPVAAGLDVRGTITYTK